MSIATPTRPRIPEKLERLLPLLRCPQCDSNLAVGEGRLECGAAGHTYEMLDGVPVLLPTEERSHLDFDFERASQMQTEFRYGLGVAVKKAAKRLIGSHLRMARSAKVTETMSSFDSEWCLEVGSGMKSSSPWKVNLDIQPFPGVDVLGSGSNLPFADDSFAMVRSLAVLEHVREPGPMVQEICRVVRPGGYVFTEVPFIQHFHAYPNDFQRYTIEGLKQAFRGFEVVEAGVGIGPSSALTAMIGDWLELFTFSNKRWLNDIVRAVPLTLLWPLKFFDYLLVKNPRAHEIAAGLYLLCRKPD